MAIEKKKKAILKKALKDKIEEKQEEKSENSDEEKSESKSEEDSEDSDEETSGKGGPGYKNITDTVKNNSKKTGKATLNNLKAFKQKVC